MQELSRNDKEQWHPVTRYQVIGEREIKEQNECSTSTDKSHCISRLISYLVCKWLVWDEVSENLLMPHSIWLCVSLSDSLWRLDELHDVLKVAIGRTKENGALLSHTVTLMEEPLPPSLTTSFFLCFFCGFGCICIWNFTLKRIHSESDLMVHGAHNPVTWEVEAGGKGVQGSPLIHGDLGSRAIQGLPPHSC